MLRLEVQNTPSPSACDSSPFTLLTSITLTVGVLLKYQDVLDFLANSAQPEEHHLADVKFTSAA